jgi:hypothetical protein
MIAKLIMDTVGAPLPQKILQTDAILEHPEKIKLSEIEMFALPEVILMLQLKWMGGIKSPVIELSKFQWGNLQQHLKTPINFEPEFERCSFYIQLEHKYNPDLDLNICNTFDLSQHLTFYNNLSETHQNMTITFTGDNALQCRNTLGIFKLAEMFGENPIKEYDLLENLLCNGLNTVENPGLTEGLVVEYMGDNYWDQNYQVDSITDKLRRDGRAILINMGKNI